MSNPRWKRSTLAPAPRASLAVIFDLDGVLIDSEALHYQAYAEALRPFGATISREVYAREWIATGRGTEYAVAKFDLPLSPSELKSRKDPIYRRLLSEGVSLMPGAKEAVVRIASRFHTAVATNSKRRDTELVLDRFGLLGRFSAVITREAYRQPKPAPDAFLAAARSVGVPAAGCVVVEDSERGVRAGHAAGMRVLAVPNAWTCDSDLALASRRLASLDELTPELVETVLAEAGGVSARAQ